MSHYNDPWWDYARGCAKALTDGRTPPTLPIHGPLLEPNESVRLSSPAAYSRLLGGDGSYDRAHAPFFVNPALMAAAMATQSAINRGRRREADRDAQPSWRNHRETSVLTTNMRLMCSRPQGGWLSFWYQDLAEYHPDLTTRTLTMSFHDDHTPPLQLAGPAAPAISLWTGYALHADNWASDPRLAALIPTTRSASTEQTTTLATPDGLTPQQGAAWYAEQQRPSRATRPTTDYGLSL